MLTRHAIVVLPPASFGLVRDDGLRRWLSRGTVEFVSSGSTLLDNVVVETGQTRAAGGQAALRYLGQTGTAPTGWVAAADPVSMRPRMRDIVVNALPPAVLPQDELSAIYASAESHLKEQDDIRIECIGQCGYLFSAYGFATPRMPPELLDGMVPDPLELAGGDPDTYYRLMTEFQMLLHDHPVNTGRVEKGWPPINGLWLWQGGISEFRDARPLPPLYTDDPLFRGQWLSTNVTPNAWPGSFTACADAAPDGFVAVLSDAADSLADPWLAELRSLLDRGRLGRLTIYFRDGLCARLTRRNRLRVWASISPTLEERKQDD